MPKIEWNETNIPDQTGRVAIVTGANSGIGYEAARALAQKNATVVIAARNSARGQAAADMIRGDSPSAKVAVHVLDLADLASIKIFAMQIADSFDRLDLLINNAGVMMCPYYKTVDGFEAQIGVNHMGHFALAGHLLPLLQKTAESRIVNVSSVAHRRGKLDFTDLNWENRKYDKSQAYGDSKLANLYFTYESANRLSGSGGLAGNSGNPIVVAAHPGWTSTNLFRHFNPVVEKLFIGIAGQRASMGALPTLRAATDVDAKSGDYFGPAKLFELRGPPKVVRSNSLSHDAKAMRKLWEISEAATGVAYL